MRADSEVRSKRCLSSAGRGPRVRGEHHVRVALKGIKLAEHIMERALRVEHAANVGPLAHVLCYYLGLALLFADVGSEQPLFRIPLWLAVVLLNYSLSVGILHMHCHRSLFRCKYCNRILELALCFPGLISASEMIVIHVHHHHRYNNGSADVTSTMGHERGVQALGYWLSYGWIVKSYTFRQLFNKDARLAWRKRRVPYVTDLVICNIAASMLIIFGVSSFLWYYFVPLCISCVTAGYFAWLSHASTDKGGSVNNVNNLLNLFIFNQGYHSVHHRHPGIHWTDIPSKLEVMLDVDETCIVPYGVTLSSCWRIVIPSRFRHPGFGKRWKDRLRRQLQLGTVRWRWSSYFIWI
jgi:fatty acid desaturase